MNQHELDADETGGRLAGESPTEQDAELSEDDLDQVAGGDWAPTPPPPSGGGGP